jgi:hypothetical protein
MIKQNISMQQLKEQRLTPAEKFVLDKVKGVKPNETAYGTRWCKDDKWLFKQNFESGDLYVNYNAIWVVLAKEYNLNSNEILSLLTKLLHNYTNNGQLKIMI